MLYRRMIAAAVALPWSMIQTAGAQGVSLSRADSLWARNYATNDTTTAKQLFSNNLAVFSSSGTIKNKAAELADVGPAPGLTMQYFRTRNVRTREHGNLGLVSGLAEWAFQQGGQTRSIQRGYTAAYKRGGALGWELIALRMGQAGPAVDADAAPLRTNVEALLGAMVAAFKRDAASVARFYAARVDHLERPVCIAGKLRPVGIHRSSSG